MDENQQDKTGNRLITTEDEPNLSLPHKEAEEGRRARAELEFWRMQSQRRWVTKVSAAIILIAITALLIVIAGYWFNWDWTGFGTASIKWTVQAPNGTTYVTVNEQQPAKTLWDWLLLLGVLAIPVVVGLGAAFFTAQQGAASEVSRARRHQTEIEIAGKDRERVRQTELKIALDKQYEVVLQNYLDRVSKDLPFRRRDIGWREETRIQTLTVLHRLDGIRKRIVLQFLYDSRLIINKNDDIIDLSGAELKQADLNKINLQNVHLGGALCWEVDLRGADLRGAYLGGVEFREATWNGANLNGAYLQNAKFLDAYGEPRKVPLGTIIAELEAQEVSLKGATLPDGSIHP